MDFSAQMAVTREQKDISDWSKGKNGHHALGNNERPEDENLVTEAKIIFGQNVLVRAEFGYVQLHILALTMFLTLESRVHKLKQIGFC